MTQIFVLKILLPNRIGTIATTVNSCKKFVSEDDLHHLLDLYPIEVKIGMWNPGEAKTCASLHLTETKLGMLSRCEIKLFQAEFNSYEGNVAMATSEYVDFRHLALLQWQLLHHSKQPQKRILWLETALYRVLMMSNA